MNQNIFSHIDHIFMEEALKESKKAFTQHEVPVGAVLSWKGKIIARAFNQMESLKDPSAHAELLCLREGARVLGDWRLLGCTLYSTLEPCLMCSGALFLARVERVVWGAPDLRHGANGSFLDVFEKKHPTHSILIQGGLFEEEAGGLMQEFFKRRRYEKSSGKPI